MTRLLCRRPSFRAGFEIKLADGHEWTFPAPQDRSISSDSGAGDEYLGLLRAVWEAEDIHERRLGELALAIYLIELNYQLSPAQLEFLFTFPPKSPELADSQRAFDLLAREHLQSVSREAILPPPPSLTRPPWRIGCTRLPAWLRGLWPLRRWLLQSGNGEAIS